MTNFSRLSRIWLDWTILVRMANVSVSSDCDDCQILFKSDDGSFHLRQDNVWWIIDTVDDRGKRYIAVAKFSTFDLAEKFLIWNWGSATHSFVGGQIGVRLNNLGMALDVDVEPTEREYTVELRTPDGSAILALADATIFSHLMSKSVDEIEQMFTAGIG